MKIAFVNGVNSDIDSSRGIGVNTNMLIESLKNLRSNKLEIVDSTNKANITHYTKFHPFFVSLPFTKPSKKVVLTIHDLIPLIYPKHYPPGIRGSVNFLINRFLIWKNVDEIITISETSKKDICRFLHIDPKKVHVIYLASKDEYKPINNQKFLDEIKKKYNLPKSFAFYFGDINYNKNIPTLVKACADLKLPLVIGGKQAKELESMDLNHPENLHLKNIYKDMIDDKKVLRLGYISDEEANAVYNLALVCVQPSFYEGFGLSVIHAFAAGCPVVAAKTQVLVEIGDGACLFADPNSPKDMAEKISQVVNNKSIREGLIKKGYTLVKKFSWEKTAKETLEVYAHI